MQKRLLRLLLILLLLISITRQQLKARVGICGPLQKLSYEMKMERGKDRREVARPRPPQRNNNNSIFLH